MPINKDTLLELLKPHVEVELIDTRISIDNFLFIEIDKIEKCEFRTKSNDDLTYMFFQLGYRFLSYYIKDKEVHLF